MVIFLIKHLFPVKPCARSNINLTSDNRLYALAFTRLIKINSPVHITMVGNSKRLHTKLLCTQNKLLDTAGAVKQRKFRMQMQMSKHIINSFYKSFEISTILFNLWFIPLLLIGGLQS